MGTVSIAKSDPSFSQVAAPGRNRGAGAGLDNPDWMEGFIAADGKPLDGIRARAISFRALPNNLLSEACGCPVLTCDGSIHEAGLTGAQQFAQDEAGS